MMESPLTETETFLKDRVNKAIEEIARLLKKESKAPCCAQMWNNISSNLNNLPNEILEKAEVDSRYHHLYCLNSRIAEWRKQLKKPKGFYEQAPCWVCRLHLKIKETIDEVQSSLRKKSSQKKERTESSTKTDREAFRWSSPAAAVPKQVYGIDDRIMIMKRLLLRKDSFTTIGIVGMAGVGKTAICQLVFNYPEVKDDYFPRIWVCLSKQSKDKPKTDGEYQKEVVKRILTSLGLEENVINNSGQGCDLRCLLVAMQQHLKGKRYLLVLDDVWNSAQCSTLTQDVNEAKQDEQDWLAYGLPKGDGGAVIVTSRYESMATKMVGEKNLLHVLPLEDKQSCWKICKDAIQLADCLPEEERKLKEKIVNECDGLPLLAKMMARAIDKKLKDQKTRAQRETPHQEHD